VTLRPKTVSQGYGQHFRHSLNSSGINQQEPVFHVLFHRPASMKLKLLILALCAASAASAATLRQLSLDEMTQSATAIVRARVTGSSASLTGRTIYTHYKLQVTESLKGGSVTEVLLPGGVAAGYRQSFPGVPQLRTGTEYLLFLWTSPTTHIIHILGLSQGLFNVGTQPDGSLQAARARIGETMLDATGRVVQDHAVQLNLSDLRLRLGKPAPTGPGK
jgi:hypothetical protein